MVDERAPATGVEAEAGAVDDGPAEGEEQAVRPTLPRGWRALVLAGLAVLFLVMGVAQARSDSLTIDESPDIAAGVSEWVHRDARINPEHGLLPHLSVGLLPVLFADPVVPEGESWRSGDWFAYTDDFVSANDEAGRLDDVVFWARVPALVVGLLAALVIHALATRLGGPDAGLLATGAWLTTPVVIGMHHLASIDPATALAVLLVVLTSVRLVEAPSDRRAAVAGLALGALLLTRHSGAALVLVPVATAVVTAVARRDRIRRVAVVLVVATALVWGLFRAVDPSGPEGVVREQQQALVDEAAEQSAVARLTAAAPLPLEWRAGFGWLTVSSGPKVSSALGQRWEGSRWWYYPVSLALASPPLTLVLLGLAPLAWARVRRAPPPRRRALAVIAGAAALVFVPLLAQPLQVGPRLMLPVLALGLVLGAVAAGGVVAWRPARRRVVLAAGAVLAVAQLALVVGSSPSSFGWTSPGLRPEHRWAGTQATDIGQDRDRLAAWAAARGDDPVAASVLLPLGQGLPPGVRDLEDVPADELTGWVAVSVSALVTFGPDLSWLRAHCNVDTVGRSILVYRFDTPPDRRPGPGLPVEACSGSEVSSRP
ncbi:MAG TPA: glycosyltransferase family 39 protein [Iamia sp.]